ncbi:MAG TPA: thioredoxin family protein [Vicinamibacterales bacterium]|nr:thioredoxin family protein [Vicinamibacterales bacterium]
MLIPHVILAVLVTGFPAQPDLQAVYAQGITWQAFYDAADVRRELWRKNTERAPSTVTADHVERLRKAGTGLTLLAVSEAACSDSVNTVPFLAELSARAGIEMRIVGKAAAEPLLDAHRTPDGRTATPTVILVRGGRDVGAWVERPAALQTWFLAATDVPLRERVERKMSWYEWDRGASTVADFLAVVEASASRF